jgi:cytochrome c
MLREAGIILVSAALLVGQVSDASKKLAEESEAYCAATATTKPTPKMIMDKVDEACALLSKEGKKAFPKFKGKNSTFIFAGTYIWVNDMNGKMLMHPIKPGMENQEMIGLKDSNGKRFFVDMISICKEKGSGWVDYMWPKPGATERSLKVSYVKKVTCDNVDVVVGCGVYDMTMDEISKAVDK